MLVRHENARGAAFVLVLSLLSFAALHRHLRIGLALVAALRARTGAAAHHAHALAAHHALAAAAAHHAHAPVAHHACAGRDAAATTTVQWPATLIAARVLRGSPEEQEVRIGAAGKIVANGPAVRDIRHTLKL